MKKKEKRLLFLGNVFVGVFIIWTLLIQKVDVQPLGVNGTNIGFSKINCWFHQLTGGTWKSIISQIGWGLFRFLYV